MLSQIWDSPPPTANTSIYFSHSQIKIILYLDGEEKHIDLKIDYSMRKLLLILIASCVLLMGYGCKSQRTLSAYESLRHRYISVFYEPYYPGLNYQSHIILTQGGKNTGRGIYMYTPFQVNSATMGEWELVNDTLYIYRAFWINPTDTNKLALNQLTPSIDTVTMRYKIIDDGLYNITDLTEFNKSFMDEFGLHSDPFYYKYDPNPKFPEYKLLRITK